MVKWRDDVVAALEDIGGKGTLSEIYDAVRKRRQTKLPKTWEAVVRRELEYNSSDSESFQGRFDLFSSDGIGTGIWSLRDGVTAERPWSDAEVSDLVSDYFSMLSEELRGHKYNKTAHRERLMETISRTNGAIERKHQNVSAVLRKLGYPWIQGYKPLKNVQEALTQEVLRQLEADNPRPSDALAKPKVTRKTLDTVFVDRPEGKERQTHKRDNKFVARKVDFAAIDARNEALGHAGEKFVVAVEKARLLDLGLHEQSKLVRWVARDDGDGLGYDVLSYDDNGERIFIEVKTTRGDSYTPFYLTETERLFAIMNAERYRLYRVFRFGKHPMIYVLPGLLEGVVKLEPTAYRVSISPLETPSVIAAAPGAN